MHEVDSAGATIGRDLENVICLTDLEASRTHCQIVYQDDRFYLVDLKSSNGTTINGKIIARQPIAVGDHIQVGQTLIVVMDNHKAAMETNADSGIRPRADSEFETQTIVRPAPKAPKPRANSPSTLSFGSVAHRQGDSERFEAVMKSNLQFMYNASLATARNETEPMLEEVLALVFQWTKADRGCIMLRDGPRDVLQPKVVKHRDQKKKDEPVQISRSIVQHVDGKAEGVISSDFPQSNDPGGRENGQALCVPITGRNYGLGLIYIEKNFRDDDASERFDEDHLKLVHVIAHQIAAAIENHEYYQTLLEKDRLLTIGETTEKLSHRIKNILQSINGGTFLVDEGLATGSFQTSQNGWAIVKRNQNRIARLILDMLLISKDYHPDKIPFSIIEMLDEAVEKKRPDAEKVNVKIDYQRGMLPTEVVGDRRGLQNAVEYVIDEAVKNSRGVDRPEVAVRVTADREILEVIVESAMPEIGDEPRHDYHSKIFSTGKQFFPGIELSVSQKILRGHDGDVEIVNEYDHERYRIWLPIVDEKQGI